MEEAGSKAVVDMLNRYVDFLWNIVNLFVRAFAFFLAINAAAIGYLSSDTGVSTLRPMASVFGAVTSLLFFLCLIGFVWWVRAVAESIEVVGLSLDRDLFERFQFSRHHRVGRQVIATFGICTGAMVIMVFSVYVYILKTG